MLKWCNRKEGQVGEQKIHERRKHRSSAFRRHLSVFTFFLFPFASARLGLAREIRRTQALSSWTPVTPPSASATVVSCYHYFLPSITVAAAVVDRYFYRYLPQLLAPLLSTAASVDRRHRWTLTPPSPADLVADRHCRQPLPLTLPPSAATTAASGLCHKKWTGSIFLRNKATNIYLYFTITPFHHPPFHHCTIGHLKKYNKIT